MKLSSHQLRALAHELEPEVATGTRCQPHEIEAPTVVGDDEGVSLEADGDAARRRMLANVLNCLLQNPKDRCAGRRRQPLVDALDIGIDRDAMALLQLLGSFGDGRCQPDVDDRRPWVVSGRTFRTNRLPWS